MYYNSVVLYMCKCFFALETLNKVSTQKSSPIPPPPHPSTVHLSLQKKNTRLKPNRDPSAFLQFIRRKKRLLRPTQAALSSSWSHRAAGPIMPPITSKFSRAEQSLPYGRPFLQHRPRPPLSPFTINVHHHYNPTPVISLSFSFFSTLSLSFSLSLYLSFYLS